MMVCTALKHEKRLEMLLGERKGSNVTIANRSLLLNHRITQEKRDTTVPLNAIRQTAEIIGNHTNKVHGGAVSVVMKRIENGLQRIKSVCPISRLADMQESVVRKARTLLKSGRSLKIFIKTNALYARKKNLSPKTMLYHFQWVVQITLQIFSHYVEIATVKNGLNFNIYENPELVEGGTGE